MRSLTFTYPGKRLCRRSDAPGAGPSCLLATAPTAGQPCLRAKTTWALAWTSEGPALSACSTLPSGQIDALNRPLPVGLTLSTSIRLHTSRVSVTWCWLKCKLKHGRSSDDTLKGLQRLYLGELPLAY
jgi:hypothetical protein